MTVQTVKARAGTGPRSAVGSLDPPGASAGGDGLTGRPLEILRAACDVIRRDGAYRLRMEAVAREAGVSKALVHYYFSTRQDLVRAAFSYGEREARVRLETELAALETSVERLERFLSSYLDPDPVFSRYRALWIEAWSGMRLDERLRPDIQTLYESWISRLRDLVGQVVGADSPAADDLVWRLTALVDGLDSLILLELVSAERARELIRETIARELLSSENVKQGRGSDKEGQP